MYSIILFAPLLGCLVAGLFSRQIGERAAQILPTTLLFVSAFFSWIAFFRVGFLGTGEQIIPLFSWITSGDLQATWSIRVDTLSVVMMVVVTTVSSLVHLYSIGYMSHDSGKARFFSYLSLFTFAMLALVSANDLVQMFFGWEGVGLASYLLIGFWFKKPSACAASVKAFIVNRIGDFGFIIGILGLFAFFGTVDFTSLFALAPDAAGFSFRFLAMDVGLLDILCLLLFLGAMGKSAQFLLHTWLPDAMEGPTPVSALIHAATMVTAGVFMLVRLSPIFEYAPTALAIVAVVGAITAFFAATVGLAQNDIKRVIAYSTCSQLGYMFLAVGIGAYQAAMFHLFTHAFFKALLFLGAGSVIHAVNNEQDMRLMGGLRRKIPYTYGAMLIGTLALTGFPMLAGYYSKDLIIEAAYAAHSDVAKFGFLLLITAAVFTSLYSWRLVFMTFHGKSRAPSEVFANAHESPKTMLVPLAVLAFGAVFAGLMFKGGFVGDMQAEFWRSSIFVGEHNHVLHEAHHTPLNVQLAPLFAMITGFLLAWFFYSYAPQLPARLAATQEVLYSFLREKWYFDQIYDALFVRPILRLARFFWLVGDLRTIDGVINGLSMKIMPAMSRFSGRLQSGYIFHYVFAMLIGVAVLIAYMSFDNTQLVDLAANGKGH